MTSEVPYNFIYDTFPDARHNPLSTSIISVPVIIKSSTVMKLQSSGLWEKYWPGERLGEAAHKSNWVGLYYTSQVTGAMCSCASERRFKLFKVPQHFMIQCRFNNMDKGNCSTHQQNRILHGILQSIPKHPFHRISLLHWTPIKHIKWVLSAHLCRKKIPVLLTTNLFVHYITITYTISCSTQEHQVLFQISSGKKQSWLYYKAKIPRSVLV